MKKLLWALSEAVLPHNHVFDFNQALMDFGATRCTARKPQCPGCPMRARCVSAGRFVSAGAESPGPR